MPDLDWGPEDLIRKYSNTFCIVVGEKESKLLYVAELHQTNDPNLPLYVQPYDIYDTPVKPITQQKVPVVGAVTAHTAGHLKIDGKECPSVMLTGYSKRAGYVTVGTDDVLYIGYRIPSKSFFWGMHKDVWKCTVAAGSYLTGLGQRIIDFVYFTFKSRKVTDKYQLLSNEVVVVEGVIKFLEVPVGFLVGNVAKIKSPAVGKILSEVAPEWTIVYW
jgi:hypothetical protein